MRAHEFVNEGNCWEVINEVAYAGGIPPLPTFDLTQAKQEGDIENNIVWSFNDGVETFFFFKPTNKISAYVVVMNTKHRNHYPMVRVENISAPKGSITALIVFVVTKMNMKLTVPENEPLTYQGMVWLYKLIKRKSSSLTLYDQDGKYPNEQELATEWNYLQQNADSTHGKTAIFIESKNINSKPMFEMKERKGIMLPAYTILHDLELE